jgi:hypothetical protein
MTAEDYSAMNDFTGSVAKKQAQRKSLGIHIEVADAIEEER